MSIPSIKHNLQTKKAQVYYTEFIITIFVFLVALVIFSRTVINLKTNEGVDDLLAQAQSISSSLMSSGYPSDWNLTTVEKIGITNGKGRIDEQKLSLFSNISYENMRSLFNIRSEYYMFLEDENGTRIQIDGKQGVGRNFSNAKKLVKSIRYPIYNSEIIRMVIYAWVE